jgi:two-component system NtrC family response regulator
VQDSDKHLLIVEDDEGLQRQLRWCFDGYEVAVAGDRKDAIARVRRHQPGVVLLDLGLPPDPGGVSEGLATLQEIQALSPETKVIIVTGDNQRANAVRAIALGAYDFYQKPVEQEVLTLMVDRAYRVHELELENRRLHQAQISEPMNGIIATSPQMLKVCRTIEKVAPSDVTVLLLGASGTGKERVAQALHERSPRARQRMVAINCAAIPENLLESELFGYEKGAFTGAVKQTQGKIEYANGGTLFLDEIGDLPLALQSKLLRFLQERVIERVGGREEIPINVRIICATHQDLQGKIADGSFREDLYYRISEITIKIPAVKDRDGDALVLAKAFLNRFCQEQGRAIRGFDRDATAAIEAHAWPGNVREIESRVKRAIIMADGTYITPDDLELDVVEKESTPLNLKQVREEAEMRAIQRALVSADDNISEAAKLLGVTRPTLYSLVEKYNLK